MAYKSIKNILTLSVLVLMLGACGPYQDALKGNEIQPKYDLAVKYYKEGMKTNRNSRLKRAIRLLEQILPQYRGKPQGEYLSYMYANAYYRLEDYYDAGYQFERFVKSYPQSDKAEEAAFKSAKSYYYISPRYSLDQTDTHKAIRKLQHYISKYPGGEHIGEANQIIASLRVKLEKKKFEIAELYYLQEDWKAAIASMTNFINENPGSPFLEKARYYRMNAEYVLAINSFISVMKERLQKANKYAEDYIEFYPKGKHIERAKEIKKSTKKRLKTFNA